MNWLREHRWEVGIVVLALLVRLLYLGISIETFGGGKLVPAISGADGYFTISQNIIHGHGLTDSSSPPYEPYSFRPPLYHFFIVGSYYLFGGFLGVILLQILIGSLLPLIGMRLASYVLENKKLQLLIGVILAVEPSAILYSNMFYSETFFMLLFFGALWALFAYFKDKKLSFIIISALLLGLATLARPATQYVPIIVAAVLLWESRARFSRQTFIAIGAYVAVFFLVLSPWIYRNYTVFGVAGISPQTGVALRMVLLPTVYSIDRGTTFQSEYATLEASGLRGPNDASITDGGPYTQAAVPLLLEHPRALLLSALNSEWSFFAMDGVFDFLRHIEIRPAEMLGKPSMAALFTDPVGFVLYFAHNLWGPLAFILLGRLVWIGITIAFFFGSWRYLRTYGARPIAVLAFALVLYMAATVSITGYGLTARYRLPVNVFVLTFALYGITVVSPKVLAVTKRLLHV